MTNRDGQPRQRAAGAGRKHELIDGQRVNIFIDAPTRELLAEVGEAENCSRSEAIRIVAAFYKENQKKSVQKNAKSKP